MMDWLLRLLGIDSAPDPGPTIRPPKYVSGMEKPDGREKMAGRATCINHSQVRAVTCCLVCLADLCEECNQVHNHPLGSGPITPLTPPVV